MKLHTLISYLQPYKTYSGDNPDISSIENDSRNIQKGSLFICIKGYNVDGHDYAGLAVQNGAAAIIAEKDMNLTVPVIVVPDSKRAMAVLADAFLGQPSRELHLIGITGTNGKTTISHLIEKIISDSGKKTGLIGTMYTKIDGKEYEVKNTTPDSLTLQKIFKQMVDEGVSSTVMEVSSHALDEGRIHGCDFNIAVFSNLTQDHLDYHKTMEAYKNAKGLLFSQLGSCFSHNPPKFAVLNNDDEATKSYIRATAAHILTYGIDHKADLQAKNIQMTSTGTTFELISPFGVHTVSMQLIGKFSVYNVLASIGAGIATGISIEEIIHSIKEVQGVSGRFETVDAGQDFSVIVDYSHTPDSLKNALSTVKQFAKKRVFVIVGCGGDRDRSKRPLMAEIACRFSSDPIFTSDNPRSEDPNQILKDMEEGVQGHPYKLIADRKEAIYYAVKAANEGDVILIAGKGHETYQLIGNQIIHFDDREVAKEAIEGR
ncbi:UDP-N-acetylmuramoyl-L-alanyl-D-glutamate--2,6-diaminopimelate ligase [Cytobacillus solani]|uniref:UDP-N-acetylmuramoyl-L-alanyl-D-glutamate--2,6-diaminopimelate ligase n=1 Tax=Cytobacillus solani TaxID=1637975 RepID=A0A0Q3VGS0_9BACI|nr:UDP-N-acetylmuramoyl-L-alanyl-D-glutamate--2,6-diaminopimelate ligase [Cytobacillus solani]KOP82041.1 UDP-N-acetylmuramoylalanyl-D-glutamate--2,6-diaminopimelate ligase [Bacillus sp. FJAT-21945]KQL18995.1 UDP-N-acetylmuramoylalanyl-D-glutamate--2,6-diaminopimelate ligase [Cytobacillus solani]